MIVAGNSFLSAQEIPRPPMATRPGVAVAEVVVDELGRAVEGLLRRGAEAVAVSTARATASARFDRRGRVRMRFVIAIAEDPHGSRQVFDSSIYPVPGCR